MGPRAVSDSGGEGRELVDMHPPYEADRQHVFTTGAESPTPRICDDVCMPVLEMSQRCNLLRDTRRPCLLPQEMLPSLRICRRCSMCKKLERVANMGILNGMDLSEVVETRS